MRAKLYLSVLMVMLEFLVVSCTNGTAADESPGWFSDNLRCLTDEEKNRMIEIALNTPEALEWLDELGTYEARLSWIAVIWEGEEGGSINQYWVLDYDVAEDGIPASVSNSARIYSRVLINFGEPPRWMVSVAVDPDTGTVVLVEEYPYRTGPDFD